MSTKMRWILVGVVILVTLGCAVLAPRNTENVPPSQNTPSDSGFLQAVTPGSPPVSGTENLPPTTIPLENTPPTVPGANPNQFSPGGVLPPDVMSQVGYYLGAGGGVETCNFEPSQPGALETYMGDLSSPANGVDIPVTAGTLDWCICGITQNPRTAKLTLPDGSNLGLDVQQNADMITPQYQCGYVEYPVRPGVQLGVYKFTFTNASSILTDQVNLVIPSTPSGVWLKDTNEAWFAGYQPGESIRLLVFISTTQDNVEWSFMGEKQLIANDSGMLMVSFNPTLAQSGHLVVAAIGDRSGRAAIKTEEGGPDYENGIVSIFLKDCGGGQITRLTPGGSAVVLQDNLSLYNDRDKSTEVTPLPVGATLKVIGSPLCDQMGNWTWNVQTQDGLNGWAQETDGPTYYLQPK
jgi:hypothetical protein